MEAVIKKWQQKLRKAKEEMNKWEALQVGWVSRFSNASKIIQRLQEIQTPGSYGALRCVKGIEDAVLQKQMAQLENTLLSMRNDLEEFQGCVLTFEKLHREGSQLLKMEPSKRRINERIGVKPCVADCMEGLTLLYEMHQSEYHLKSSIFSALSCLILKPSPGDLNALQYLVVDQPNIPNNEGGYSHHLERTKCEEAWRHGGSAYRVDKIHEQLGQISISID